MGEIAPDRAGPRNCLSRSGALAGVYNDQSRMPDDQVSSQDHYLYHKCSGAIILHGPEEVFMANGISKAQQMSATGKVDVLRFALTFAMASALLFILCWIVTWLPITSPTHMYLQFFTAADPGSALAFGEGLCWSLLFGLIAGGLTALCYNALAFMRNR